MIAPPDINNIVANFETVKNNSMKLKSFYLACSISLLGIQTVAANASFQLPSGDSTKYRLEIERMSRSKKIRSALNLIKTVDDETIRNQISLTEIEAPPFMESKFGKTKFFSELLIKYGADSVWTDSIGNVIGLLKGTERKKVLAVAGHLDTVFPEGTDVKVTRSNDTLYAPGISDDNRGLTAVLTLLRTLTESGIQTKDDILFIGDVGEEGLGDLRGMKYLFREGGPQIDAFISIEPGSMARITNGGLGSHRYKITINGPGGHSWGSFGLANPAHALGEVISIFTKKADEYTRSGEKTSYNIGVIGGGTSVNSVPFSAWMEVDMRSLSQERLTGIDTILQRAIRAGLQKQNYIRRSGPELTVNVEMVGNRPSGHTPEDDPLVQRAIAGSLFMGSKPQLQTSSTDSNIPISKGIPAVTLGAGGRSGKSHSLHEWYYNKNGYKGIQRIFILIAVQAGAISN